MTNPCSDIRPECAHVFREIGGIAQKTHEAVGELRQDAAARAEVLKRVEWHLGKLSAAVLGNGQPASGLAARLLVLEDRTGPARDRFWKIFGVIVSLIAVLLAVLPKLAR